MTRRGILIRVVVTLVVLASIPVAYFYWHLGGSSVLIVSNVGSTPIEGASVVILDEGIDAVHDSWPLPTIASGSSVGVDVSWADSNPALRLRNLDGGTTTRRIRVYLGPPPREIRVNVADGGIVNALWKRLRGYEYDEARVVDVPVEIQIPPLPR